MLNIDDIHPRLERWAEWVLRRESGGLGYPRECSYTRLAARSGNGFVPSADHESWQTEQAVVLLARSDELLHQVITVRYLSTRTPEQMFRVCNCSERTFYRRLQDAREIIKKSLDTLGSKNV